MDFFAWIRDGVRRAVLLGVSDAVVDLGTGQEDEIHQRLVDALRNSRAAIGAETVHDTSKRKKLGRGLEQIQAGLAKVS
jgi:hypothetical protein